MSRLVSIDVMRGITLLLMLFVNDLYTPGVPSWLGHMDADSDGMGLADWVFPGFLFMVGMAIPVSIGKRIRTGQETRSIARHIVIRSASLIIIGVLMMNTERVNTELTGMKNSIWALLMYAGVFLTWNDYRDSDRNFFTVTTLRLIGMALLTFLVFRFRSGEPENEGSIITGWWGILGIIGWGYLASSFIYLFVRENILNIFVAFLFFLLLNILTSLGVLTWLDPIRPLLGVIVDGNVPMIILSGVIIALLMKQYSGDKYKFQLVLFSAGVASIIAGFILRNWIIISKIQATPSWGLICNGISIFLFAVLHYITDVRRKSGWINIVRPAGENSLTTYLAPSILYHLIWLTGIPVLFYKQADEPIVIIAGSIIWSLLMAGLAAILVKYGIRLKL